MNTLAENVLSSLALVDITTDGINIHAQKRFSTKNLAPDHYAFLSPEQIVQ